MFTRAVTASGHQVQGGAKGAGGVKGGVKGGAKGGRVGNMKRKIRRKSSRLGPLRKLSTRLLFSQHVSQLLPNNQHRPVLSVNPAKTPLLGQRRKPQILINEIEISTRVTINVSGRKFLIDRDFLTEYPTTLLGSEQIELFYDSKNKEYFFDRNRDTFESIFDFYLYGKLYPPRGIPDDMYMDEVRYFEMMTVFKPQEEENLDPIEERISGPRSLCHAINNALENPNRYTGGKIWSFMDLFFIILSVATMMIETNPYIKEKIEETGSVEQRVAFIVESVTVIFFTVDVLLRFLVTDKKLQFVKSPATALDVVTIAPYYLELFIDVSKWKSLRVLRLARVVRVLKLVKKNKRLLLIARVMSQSMGELSLLIIVWMMCVTVAGSVFYYVETDLNENVASACDGLWWAIVTMSTVGYGDIYPVTYTGKAFSTVYFYISMVFLALPLTIIVGAFSKQYENRKTWSIIKKK